MTAVLAPSTADAVYGPMSVVRDGYANPAAVGASAPTQMPAAQDDGPPRERLTVAGVLEDPTAWLVVTLGAAFLLARYAAG